MKKTGFHSYANGEISQGCKLCVQGKKLVLFITGICPRSCYFCPLSEQKYQKDVIFANERPIKDVLELIEEAEVSGAEGVGITGGDPLAVFERTIEYITKIKKRFPKFHIHLYTSLNLVTEEKIKKLEQAGLDEIRFHLSLDSEEIWEKIKIPTTMKKGIEIPCIPGKDYRKLIAYARKYVDFFNLNELEYADAAQNKLEELGFRSKNPYSYGIAGSEKLAIQIGKEFPEVRIHYCTVKLKDSVQFVNRLSLRAQKIKKDYDIAQGPTLLRGAIYGEEDIFIMKEKLSPFFFVDVDEKKKRLLCSLKDLRKYLSQIKKLGYHAVEVEDLASYDLMEIESQEL